MRVVIQRVNHAQVAIDNEVVGKIKKGFLLLVGIGQDDNEEVVAKAAQKIAKMRIFEDEAGKTNLSLADVNGEILSVSQFTLLTDTKKVIVQALLRQCAHQRLMNCGKSLIMNLKKLAFMLKLVILELI